MFIDFSMVVLTHVSVAHLTDLDYKVNLQTPILTKVNNFNSIAKRNLTLRRKALCSKVKSMSKSNQDNEQILKGLLDTLVLNVLTPKANYGFGIREALQVQLGDDADVVKEATLYPLLHRLERRGLLTSFRQPGDRGTPRKYYQVTPEGLAFLRGRIEEWRKVSSLLERTILKEEE